MDGVLALAKAAGRWCRSWLGVLLSAPVLAGCDSAKAESRYGTLTSSRLSTVSSLIRASKFTEAAARGCPAGMARIKDFCVDRFEATLVEVGPDGQEVPHPAFERPAEGV